MSNPGSFGGMVVWYSRRRPRRLSQLEHEVAMQRAARFGREFAAFVCKRTLTCCGCGKTILEIDLHHHEHLGCEIAIAIGHGSIVSQTKQAEMA